MLYTNRFWRSVFAARAVLKICCVPIAVLIAPVATAQQTTDDSTQSSYTPAATVNGSTDEGAAPAEPTAKRLDEVTVTARRREEPLQDLPVSVSAFSEAQLKDLQADDITGIQNFVPNLTLEQGDASNAVIFLRGIGQNDSLAFVESGVAVYVDDVFISRSQAAFLDTFDIERIEVLRGPQGTLYGRNSPGGAVKFISKAPPQNLEAYLEVGGGRFDFFTAKGSVGGTLVDNLVRGKVAFSATEQDGFSRNSFLGGRDGDTESYALRGSLLFTPHDDLDVTFTADYKRSRPDTSRSPVRVTDLVAFEDPFGAPDVPTVFGPNEKHFVVETNANGLNHLTSYGFTTKVDWRPSPSWTLESITAYREMEFNLTLDTDGSPLPVLDVALFQDQDQFSQELRASYDAGNGLTLTGGVFYFHDDDLTLSGFDLSAASVFGFPIVAFGFPTSQLADTKQDTDSIAVFAHATIDLTDRTNLELGLRYTRDEKTSKRRFENFFDPDLQVARDFPPFLSGAGVAGPAFRGNKSWDAFTPRIALSYAISDDVMAYGSASRGFKSGGFDGRANSEFGFTPFSPETVWTYEGGVKSSWLANRLTANAAYFYSRYRNLQVTSFGQDPDSGFFQSLFTNAAAARIQGVELDVEALPLDSLTLNATLGYLDAEYRKFEALVGGVVTDVSDRSLINSPKWNASLGATFEHYVGSFYLTRWHVDAAYRSDTANEITDSPELRQDQYATLNAFVSLTSPDEHWELRLGAKNLTDRDIRVQGFNLSEFPGVQTAFFGARRTWDLRLIYRF